MKFTVQQRVAGSPFVLGMSLHGLPAYADVPTRWIAPNSTRRFRGEHFC